MEVRHGSLGFNGFSEQGMVALGRPWVRVNRVRVGWRRNELFRVAIFVLFEFIVP